MNYTVDDIAILILTHPNNLELIKAISKTWGKRFPNIYYFTQNIANVKEYEETTGLKNVINISGPNYRYRFFMALKVAKIWQWAYSNHIGKSKWFMCIDDDTYIFTENFMQCLSDYDYTQTLYLGEVCKDAATFDIKYVDGGGGILLSSSCLEILGNYLVAHNFEKEYRRWIKVTPGDVFTAKLLYDLDILPTHLNGFIAYPQKYKLQAVGKDYLESHGFIHFGPHVKTVAKRISNYSIRRMLKELAIRINKKIQNRPDINKIKLLSQEVATHKNEIVSLHYQTAESIYAIEKVLYSPEKNIV